MALSFLKKPATSSKTETAPAPSKKGARAGTVPLGIDLGSRRIKIAALAAETGQIRARALLDMNMPPSAFAGGSLVDPEGLGEEIAAVLRDEGFKKAAATLVVGGGDVFVRRVEMSRMDKQDALRTLPSLPKLNMPSLDLESNKLDLEILDPNTPSTNMQVMMVAARKEAIRARQMAAIYAGLRIDSVDVDSCALFNVFEHCAAPGSMEAVTVVNIGHRSSLILVIARGTPLVARHVDVGVAGLMEDLTRSIEMLDEEQTEVALFQGANPAAIYPQNVGRWIDQLADEIVRSSLQVQQRHAGSRVYVCGGGALIDGLTLHLQDRIGVPVLVFNPLDTIAPVPNSHLAVEKGPAFAIALGLALRQVK